MPERDFDTHPLTPDELAEAERWLKDHDPTPEELQEAIDRADSETETVIDRIEARILKRYGELEATGHCDCEYPCSCGADRRQRGQGLREAAEIVRQTPMTRDEWEALHRPGERPISGPEATGSAATPESGEGLSLADDAERGPDSPRHLPIHPHRRGAMSELSAEDRARLEALVITATEGSELDGDDWAALMYVGSFQVAALTRALALIDQQAKALEAADELYAAIGAMQVFGGQRAGKTRVQVALDAYRSTRTTTEGEDA